MPNDLVSSDGPLKNVRITNEGVFVESAGGHVELQHTHTPGPWRWSGDSLVQTAHVTRDVWMLPRNEADQHLIAAAPDLLAALKACVALCDERLIGDMTAAKAAIAKAEGR